jgi:hypothetical protein
MWMYMLNMAQQVVPLIFACFLSISGISETGIEPYRDVYKVETTNSVISGGVRGVSMGSFIFYSIDEQEINRLFRISPEMKLTIYKKAEAKILSHEYGHILQNHLLGPYYLPVVAFPSLIANLIDSEWQKTIYVERWATELGEKYVISF